MEEYVFRYQQGDFPIVEESAEEGWDECGLTFYYCRLGKLTTEEAGQLWQHMHRVAYREDFIAEGDPEHGYYPTSGVCVTPLKHYSDSQKDEEIAFLRSSEDFQAAINRRRTFSKRHPYWLLLEAVKSAKVLQRKRTSSLPNARCNNAPHDTANDPNASPSSPNDVVVQKDLRDSKMQEDAEEQLKRRQIWIRRILGTMIHVLLKIEGIDKEEAARRVRQAINEIRDNPNNGTIPKFTKEFLLKQSFEPVSEIDEYTDCQALISGKMPEKRLEKSPIIEILRAAVVAIQCCECKKNLSKDDFEAAFGKTAYRSAAKLKKELGLEKGAS